MDARQDYRPHAIAAGVLFIVATAFLFVGEAIYKPGLTPPDVLTKAAAARSRIALGILVEFSCVLAIPLIAIVLYPLLRRVSPVLAIGYVAFRLFEAALFASMEIDRLLVLALADSLAANPGANPETLEALVQALTGGAAFSGITGPIYNLVFVPGMLMLNGMFWQARLVPRWISGWGMISALALGALVIAALFTEVSTVVAVALIAPLAVQEMVLALWMIARGFDRDALTRLPGA